MNYRELSRLYTLDGPQATVTRIGEALQSKQLSPEDFSLRDLAEAVVPDGREWVRSLNPAGGAPVAESDGVDVTAFANITGQIVYSAILAAYTSESFVLSKLVRTIPTKFDGEKIPGVNALADEAQVINPGMPFPSAGFGERWIETPATTKRGFIVPVTKEAVFFDRTHLVLSNAAEVGELLGVNKEKRLADMIAGVTNPYIENGTPLSTYQTATPWINKKTANDLVDWTDVDNAEQLFANILDPNSGEPIVIETGRMTLLATPARMHAARRVLNGTEIRFGDGANNTTQTVAPNTVDNYAPRFSRQIYRRLIASGVAAANAIQYWWLGDFQKAFAYMQNWPITVTQAPMQSEAEFTNDVIARFKASERGAAAVLNPRYVVQSTN